MSSSSAAALRVAVIALVTVFVALPAAAAWELDGQRSTVSFISVKNASIAEVHHFRALSGSVGDDGQVQLAIDLDSVETLVPIRNQRMRELLFETVRFPAATLEAAVDPQLLAVAVGETRRAALDLALDLHGRRVDYTVEALVTGGADGSVQVSLAQPLIVRAADFGLEAGVEILREVAGLKSISTAVPVDARLVFSPLR